MRTLPAISATVIAAIMVLVLIFLIPVLLQDIPIFLKERVE